MPQGKPRARLTYAQAKSWARSQSPLINGVIGWRALRKARLLPPGMPAWPQGAYPDDFESWGEFLGTGTLAAIRRNFKPYTQARAWARRQRPKITSKTEWQSMVKANGAPVDIPTDPRSHYGAKFEGWGQFLGTGRIANQCRTMVSYEEAKRWVSEQAPIIHSREEYHKRLKQLQPADIPTAPDRVYKGQFEGWPKFLGVRRIASTSMAERMLKQELASFLPVSAQATTRLMGADGRLIQVDIHLPEWDLVIEYDGSYFHRDKTVQDRAKTRALCQANPDLRVIRIREAPLRALSAIDLVVESGLDPLVLAQMVTAHMLGLGMIRTGFKRVAQSYLKRKHMAGDVVVGAKWRTYEQARAWAREQDIQTIKEWKRRSKQGGFLTADIPATPSLVYGRQFLGWSDFLGTRIVAQQHRKFWSYDRAQTWAQKRVIAGGKQWAALSVTGRLPKGIPSNPDATYKKQWRGWGAFLGTGKPSDVAWAGIDEIRAWCSSQIPVVRTPADWDIVKDGAEFPKHFPKSLHYHFGVGVFTRLREPTNIYPRI